MITSENIHMHELVGAQAHIVGSCNEQIKNVTGLVLHESKNMLYLQNADYTKMYPKAGSTWEFKINGDLFKVDGAKITKKPYERLRD